MKSSSEYEAYICSFQKEIDYTFQELRLLKEALTHPSYANEAGLPLHNQRLEFLGDAVLELVTSEKLFNENPDIKEGQLTRLRSRLVCRQTLCAWAKRVGLPRLLLLGRSIDRSGVTASMLADSAEAVFGAIFIDGGYVAARRIIRAYLELVSEAALRQKLDPKTELQELFQADGAGVPYYRSVERRGCEHALQFKVEVTLGDKVLGEAWGASLKEAEFSAALIALKARKKAGKDKNIQAKIQ